MTELPWATIEVELQTHNPFGDANVGPTLHVASQNVWTHAGDIIGVPGTDLLEGTYALVPVDSIRESVWWCAEQHAHRAPDCAEMNPIGDHRACGWKTLIDNPDQKGP